MRTLTRVPRYCLTLTIALLLALTQQTSAQEPATKALTAQRTCENLRGLTLPHTEITSAAVMPEGAIKAAPGAAVAASAPARCAVHGIARPTSDSEIRFELWLPPAGWNGKYLQLGNGGWAGSITERDLIEPLRRGYAVAATDDGHQAFAGDARWSIGHPEKLVDFGYRAVHETSQQARAAVRAYYGKESQRSYFMGCSDGGREGLMEAQRYPEDFDGIIAGAPANAWSHLMAALAVNQQALLAQPIPATKLPVIQEAALAACDAGDGVTDGLIENPAACRFDPAVLTCRGADRPDCLTRGQVATLRKLYRGPTDPRTGASIFPGFAPGAEAGGSWLPWLISAASTGGVPFERFFVNSYFGQAVHEDTTWNLRRFAPAGDVPFADRKVGTILDATSPDLRSFRARGGKLIQYHGWGDAAISPFSSVEYYESVRAFLGRFPDPRTPRRGPIQDFYRLFMVPGMGHCDGGFGPVDLGQGVVVASRDPDHNVLSALEQWVEHGIAPEKIIGSGRVVGDRSRHLSRPLCPYPQVARYNGSGDIYEATSFTCVSPAQP